MQGVHRETDVSVRVARPGELLCRGPRAPKTAKTENGSNGRNGSKEHRTP